MQNILVTGAEGFVGSWLAERLAQEGYTVTWLSRSEPIPQAKGKVVHADLCTDALEELVAGQECVFHLAAITSVQKSIANPDEAMRNNAESTKRLLEAVEATAGTRKGKLHFVLLSSDRVYGNAEGNVVTEESEPHPVDPYAESKLQAEEYCKTFAKKGHITYTIIRAGTIFGPRQRPELFIPSCILRIMEARKRGTHALPVGNLDGYRNFVYIADVIEALTASLRTVWAHNQVFNIVAEQRQMVEVVTALRQLARQRWNYEFTVVQEETLRRPQKTELPRYTLDCSKAKSILTWRPHHTFQQALEDTFSYYAA